MLSEFLPRRYILTFHGVGPLPSRPVDAAEREFWSTTDTLSKALDLAALDPNVEITFDDGNLSDLEVAVPLLLDRGLRATFFVLGGRIGWQDFLSAQDIREMDRLGMKIGSHGMDHLPWSSLDDAALHRELIHSRDILEDLLGKPVLEAAMPFGDFNGHSLRTALKAGYHQIFISSGGFASDAMRIQSRTSVRNEFYPVPDPKRRWISGLRNHVRLLKYRTNGYAGLPRPDAGRGSQADSQSAS